MLHIIHAMSINGTIGNKNALPWEFKDDLAHFKRETEGSIVVMGRKTFESLGKPLPKRTNLVLTRDRDFHYPGITRVSINDVLHLKRMNIRVFIIGGAEIYNKFLPFADRIVMTLIYKDIAGDTKFPYTVDELDRKFQVVNTRPMNTDIFKASVIELYPKHLSLTDIKYLKNKEVFIK